MNFIQQIRFGHRARALLAVLAAMVPVASGCHRSPVAPPLPVAVRVAVLKSEPISSETRFSATVRERQRFGLSFKVPGTVASLMQVKGQDGRVRDVQEGDVVTSTPDRPLARLDDSDHRRRVEGTQERLAQAQARQRAAQAAVTVAHTTYDRIKTLRENGSISQQTYDDTLARRDAADADLEAVRREVRAAEVALQQAEDDLKNCSLMVPISNATIARKFIETNERVPAGQPVFEIMDLSRVRVAFGVPDTMVTQFQLGQTVTVTADSFLGKQFQGRISKILPAADLRTRSFEIEVTIDDPQQLKPGMVVTIILGSQENALLLPMTAVQRTAGKEDFTIFTVVNEGGRTLARKRRVQLGGVYDNRIRLVETSASEVHPGDTLVVTGAFRLTENQPVRVLDLPDQIPRIQF